MLKRFSLYGFLKNQRYFEPFLLLYFLELGLSYSEIGILIAIREVFLNVAEIPSGALADIYGRRKSLIFSFSSYIISFIIFGFSNSFLTLIPAMLLFAIGDAFRTGTHKAMIFSWLRHEGRTDEKKRIYGFTRSWSKLGSAFSVIIATILLLIKPDYSIIFFFSIIPYSLGIINFLGYPRYVDGVTCEEFCFPELLKHLKESFSTVFSISHLRRLIYESMSFEGLFKSVKEYVQPFIQNMAIVYAAYFAISTEKKETITIGIVYFILAILSSFASRKSYWVADKFGGEEKSSKVMMFIAFVIYSSFIPLLYYEVYITVIILFILLNILQNFWRPILIARFDNYTEAAKGATILSIESQARTLATSIFAPLIGFSIDFIKSEDLGGEFWPIGLFGSLVTFIMVITSNNLNKKG